MAQLKSIFKKLIFTIILVSIVLSFVSAPSAQAKLSLGDNEFYYPGTTDGTYVEKKSLGEWLVEKLAEIADYILGVVTMGSRMVFVGWTALLEHMLTWVLETASGINLNGENVSATDLTALNDSSKNVTVQAIVYNRVPALNVNFFKIDVIDIFTDGDKIVSPTGAELKCKKCGKPVKECCTNMPSDKTQINIKENYCNDECKCNGKCGACQTYKGIMQSDKEPAIVQIKKLVAIWYRTISLLAYAVMLVILIFLGIKLAISNLSSDKALYKRMLYDWLVGMAIIASIQMVMYFAIIINEKAVKIVADAADEVNKVQIKHMTETDPDKLAQYEQDGIIRLSDQEIEIDVYEAIRTRAYDAKLTVGMSGMVMYMALVYYAFRYTLMYLRRLLNLAILTIMGPGIGVSYAFQKIMHGKALSFKNWLREYLLALFIQVIHAILYAVFISEALIFSLQSVAGMIFALIMIHYAFQMDKLFRKVFNFGEGGVMKDLDTAGDLAQKRKDLKALKSMAIGGTATASLVMNSPYSKAVKAVGRAAGSAAVLGASAVASSFKGAPDIEEDDELEDESSGSGRDSGDSDLPDVDGSGEPIGIGDGSDSGMPDENPTNNPVGARLNEKRKASQAKEDKELLETGRDKLRANLNKAAKELEDNPSFENRQKFEEAQRKLARYDELNQENRKKYSTSQVVAGKINQVFNISTYIQFKKGKNGKTVYKFKTGNASTGKRPGAKGLGDMLIGSSYYDPATGKIVKNKDAAIDQLRITKLLNMTKDDQKVLKENIIKPFTQGLGGIAAMYLGMATLVENPGMGMTMLIAGHSAKEKSFKTLGVRRRDRKFKKKYTFDSFNVAATERICNTAIKLSEKDRDKLMIERVKRNHYKLYMTMRKELETAKEKGADIRVSGNFVEGLSYTADDLDDLRDNYHVSVGTLKALEGGKAIFVPAEMLTSDYTDTSTEYMDATDGYDYYANPEFMSAAEKAEHDFMRETYEGSRKTGSFGSKAKSVFKAVKDAGVRAGNFDKVGSGLNNVYMHHFKQLKEQEKQAEKDKLDLTKNASRAAVSFAMRRLAEATEADKLRELGYEKDGDEVRSTTTFRDDLSTEGSELPTADQATIDRMLDIIIKQMANGKELDLESEKTLMDIIDKLGSELYASNILEIGQGAELLFEGGLSGLKTIIKRRGSRYNSTLQSIEGDLKAYSKESQDLIMDAIQEVMEDRTDSKKKYESLNPEAILEKMKERAGVTEKPGDGKEKSSSDPKSSGPVPKAKDATAEDVGKFLMCKEIIEVNEQEKAQGKKTTHSSKEVEAAKEYLDRMDENQRESMQKAVDSILSSPITEQEVMKKIEEKVESGNPFKKAYDGPLIDIKKMILTAGGKTSEGGGSGGSSGKGPGPDESFFKKTLKKIVGKANDSLSGTLSSSEVKRIVASETEKDSKAMLEMLEMVYLGDSEAAKKRVLESSDNDDIKRKKLETLLTFEQQVEKLEDINEYAMENADRLGMKNAGSKGHKALKMEVKETDLDLARKKLELAKFEREHGRIDDVDYQKLSSAEKLEYSKMRAVKSEIVEKTAKLEEKRDGLRKNGPVSDIKKDLLDMVSDNQKKKKK